MIYQQDGTDFTAFFPLSTEWKFEGKRDGEPRD